MVSQRGHQFIKRPDTRSVVEVAMKEQGNES